MKEILEDIIYTLNQLPNRKVKGKDWTTYDLVIRVEKALKEQEIKEAFSKLPNYIDYIHPLD